ncbi:hypothetical protein RFI_21833 [Reticulomyxa filosa]|uniref:Uncharacterized protein n=1 Tax=Reticulomyxa filosa TaxID=46433 RepID=X6MR04_RETFI|nr:hypothetical protein RFI_21833 [Reticulomyxa filosa]|eukprot:ETO15530.1 hypothetical protein RFI_21833 [Reticulomyxa filosa]
MEKSEYCSNSKTRSKSHRLQELQTNFIFPQRPNWTIERKFKVGVPQKSLLLSPLFLLYINYILYSVQDPIQCGIFACNVTLWTSIYTSDEKEMERQLELMQTSLDKVSLWSYKGFVQSIFGIFLCILEWSCRNTQEDTFFLDMLQSHLTLYAESMTKLPKQKMLQKHAKSIKSLIFSFFANLKKLRTLNNKLGSDDIDVGDSFNELELFTTKQLNFTKSISHLVKKISHFNFIFLKRIAFLNEKVSFLYKSKISTANCVVLMFNKANLLKQLPPFHSALFAHAKLLEPVELVAPLFYFIMHNSALGSVVAKWNLAKVLSNVEL